MPGAKGTPLPQLCLLAVLRVFLSHSACIEILAHPTALSDLEQGNGETLNDVLTGLKSRPFKRRYQGVGAGPKVVMALAKAKIEWGSPQVDNVHWDALRTVLLTACHKLGLGDFLADKAVLSLLLNRGVAGVHSDDVGGVVTVGPGVLYPTLTLIPS